MLNTFEIKEAVEAAGQCLDSILRRREYVPGSSTMRDRSPEQTALIMEIITDSMNRIQPQELPPLGVVNILPANEAGSFTTDSHIVSVFVSAVEANKFGIRDLIKSAK